MFVDHHSDIVIFPQIKEVEEAFTPLTYAKMYKEQLRLRTLGKARILFSKRICCWRPVQEY